MPKMTVYHGGYMPVKEPEIRISPDPNFRFLHRKFGSGEIRRTLVLDSTVQ